MFLIDKTLAKFIAVGIINTGIGSALMFILYNCFSFSYWTASAVNYVVGSIASFFLNKYFTFNVRHWSVSMVIAFAVNIAVSYLLAYSVAKPAVNYILKNSPQKTRENLALFAGMCLFTGLNYLGQRFVVFRKERSDQ